MTQWCASLILSNRVINLFRTNFCVEFLLLLRNGAIYTSEISKSNFSNQTNLNYACCIVR